MKRGLFVVYDPDEQYARALSGQLMRQRLLTTQCITVTMEPLLTQILQEERVELLIGAEEASWLYERNRPRHVILLSEGHMIKEGATYPSVYKYQSLDRVIQQIMDAYLQMDEDAGFTYVSGEEKKLLVVYSPSSAVARTLVASTLAKAYAKERETLYMTFDPFPVEYPLDDSGGISDLIYLLRENNQQLGTRIQSMAHHDGKLHYLAPVSHFKDLEELTAQEFLAFIRQMRENSPYEAIILEFGFFNEQVLQIMRVADGIYLPYLDVSNQGVAYPKSGEAGRVYAFQRMLLEERLEMVLKRMEVVPIKTDGVDWDAHRRELERQYVVKEDAFGRLTVPQYDRGTERMRAMG